MAGYFCDRHNVCLRVNRVLTMSVAANLLLAAAAGWVWLGRAPKPVTVTPRRALAMERAAQASAANQPVKPANFNGFNWSQIEAAEYPVYIANLRAVGCPEETIRDIIISDVEALYDGKLEELTGGSRRQFWQTPMQRAFAPGFAQARTEAAKLEKDKGDLIRQLLNVDLDSELHTYLESKHTDDPRLDFLTLDQQHALLGLRDRYRRLAEYALNVSAVPFLQSDLSALNALHEQWRNELETILNSDQVVEFDLQLSPAAVWLRQNLGGMALDKKETAELVRIRSQHDIAAALIDALVFKNDTEARRNAREALDDDLDQRIHDKLGDARYWVYQRSIDRSFQSLYMMGERLGSPATSATKAFVVLNDARKKAGSIMNDSSLTAQAQSEALQALKAEIETGLRGALDAKLFEEFVGKDRGWFENNVSRRRLN